MQGVNSNKVVESEEARDQVQVAAVGFGADRVVNLDHENSEELEDSQMQGVSSNKVVETEAARDQVEVAAFGSGADRVINLDHEEKDSQMQGVSSNKVVETEAARDEVKVAAFGSGANRVINLDHGDPTIYEAYWRKVGEKGSITIGGDESLSYFANSKSLCWFLESKLEEAIKKLHSVVGNAKVEGHEIVVGNGSSQLIQAALFALSPQDQCELPASVVSAAPFYSTYKEDANLLRSKLFQWAGDANTFNQDGHFIEMVTSPNNPDGAIRAPVVKQPGGQIVFDLAYYWPQYTAVTSELDEDVMLFTASKCTGHAGSRIGWALVRDREVAKRMIKFIEVNTIGVSKESQLRAAKILGVVSESCEDKGLENFFQHGRTLMEDRWNRLRQIVNSSQQFTLLDSPLNYCQFFEKSVETYPAFAWMRCKSNHDLAQVLKTQKVLARSGDRFGADPKYARISMLSKNEDFDMFLDRLAATEPESVPIN